MRTRYIVLDWVGKWVVWQDWPDGCIAIGDTEDEAIEKVKRAYTYTDQDGNRVLHPEDWANAEPRLRVVELPWPAEEIDPRLSDSSQEDR
jgi:hypothetical protein